MIGEHMRVFVTGISGQLGHDVVNELSSRGYDVVGSDIQKMYSGVLDGSKVESAPYVQLDITDAKAVRDINEVISLSMVIHYAAWTVVDAAEDEEKRELVHRINADGTRYIAEAVKAVDAKMVYITTDYVLDE